LPEALAGFLAVYVLLDGFEHDPVGRTAALNGKGLDAAFQGLVYLQGGGHFASLFQGITWQ
jgi:hypothetical protein